MNIFDENLRQIIKEYPIIDNKNNNELNDLNLEKIKKLRSYANEKNASKHSKMLQIISKYVKNKDCNILDFGCGGGVPLVLLKMAGYEKIYGVDLKKLQQNKINKQKYFSKLFRLDLDTFSHIVNGKTEFESEKFDVIISLQVLEHVKNFNEYFDEVVRLLKKDGILILIFPHRFKIYDSHTKLYFVHYFPKVIRGFFYNYFTKEKKQYYFDLLNLKSPFFHINKANEYFHNVNRITESKFDHFDISSYDGNFYVKKLFNYLVKFLPSYVYNLISIFMLDSILICKNKK